MYQDFLDYFRSFFGNNRKNSLVYKIRSTVSSLYWLLFFLSGFLLGALILWTFTGHIPITITGKGILVAEKGLSTLQSSFNGSLTDIKVKAGDKIKKGDLLAIGKSSLKGGSEIKIVSPSDGQVLEVWVNVGEVVKEGENLLWMENYAEGKNNPLFEIYGYFPIETGKRLNIGASVNVMVPSVDENKYGILKGKVKSIALFAVAKENIYNEIQNKALVSFLSDHESAMVKVVIDPLYDVPPDDFAWSSGLDPDYPLTSGTLVNLEAVVEKVRPIYYLLPIPEFKTIEKGEGENGPK